MPSEPSAESEMFKIVEPLETTTPQTETPVEPEVVEQLEAKPGLTATSWTFRIVKKTGNSEQVVFDYSDLHEKSGSVLFSYFFIISFMFGGVCFARTCLSWLFDGFVNILTHVTRLVKKLASFVFYMYALGNVVEFFLFWLNRQYTRAQAL
jgi:hypothetical protein